MVKKEGTAFHIILIVLIIATLGVSVYSLMEIKSLKSAPESATQSQMTLNEFLDKLTAHEELKNYKEIPPLNIIRIDNTNLANLQAQINGLDMSYIGKYIVQYTDRIVIYDLDNDQILSNLVLQQDQGSQLPQDFFSKLLQHPELRGVENVGPSGGILDATTLDTLKQRLPDIYKDAKVGDYLLRYEDRLIIYDYQADKIVGAFGVQ